jgi:hypothetical protein
MEDYMTPKDCLRIEISRSLYVKDCFNLRIGDLVGSSEHLNATENDVIYEIEQEMDDLKKVRGKRK